MSTNVKNPPKEDILLHPMGANVSPVWKPPAKDKPPCFGLDDCSSLRLAKCPVSRECGAVADDVPNASGKPTTEAAKPL